MSLGAAIPSKDSIAIQCGVDPQIATDLMERLQQHNNPALQPTGPVDEQRALGDKPPPTTPKPKPSKTGEGEDGPDERPAKKAKVQKEKVKARDRSHTLQLV